MTLRAASINNNNQILEEYLLDARVCDCCQTDVAMTQDGPIVIYRDRSEDLVRPEVASQTKRRITAVLAERTVQLATTGGVN